MSKNLRLKIPSIEKTHDQYNYKFFLRRISTDILPY